MSTFFSSLLTLSVSLFVLLSVLRHCFLFHNHLPPSFFSPLHSLSVFLFFPPSLSPSACLFLLFFSPSSSQER